MSPQLKYYDSSSLQWVNAVIGVQGTTGAQGVQGPSGSYANSAALASALSDETGTGVVVFGTAPTISNLTLSGTLTAASSVGTSGQVLVSTGTGVQWSTPAAGAAFSEFMLIGA